MAPFWLGEVSTYFVLVESNHAESRKRRKKALVEGGEGAGRARHTQRRAGEGVGGGVGGGGGLFAVGEEEKRKCVRVRRYQGNNRAKHGFGQGKPAKCEYPTGL